MPSLVQLAASSTLLTHCMTFYCCISNCTHVHCRVEGPPFYSVNYKLFLELLNRYYCTSNNKDHLSTVATIGQSANHYSNTAPLHVDHLSTKTTITQSPGCLLYAGFTVFLHGLIGIFKGAACESVPSEGLGQRWPPKLRGRVEAHGRCAEHHCLPKW